MITSNDIATLLDPKLRDYIAGHLSDDPGRVALSLREHGALVATQIKYLQRARVKLPSYYAALCILPPLSFEQSSSEETASVKRYSGDTCLDLTCGLGVDAFYLSKRFRQVIAVERNAELSEIARINFRLLGVQNIRVVDSPAEAFLEQLRGQTQTTPDRSSGTIDLIYIDPARRDDQGKKVWLLEDCSPDAKALMPQLLALAPKVVVKASPLFDVDEAFRLFGDTASVEIVSVRGECKEVLIEVSRQAPQQQEQPEKQQPWQEAGQAPQRASQPAAAMENRKKGSVLENRKDGQIRLTIAGRPSLCFDRTSGTWTDPETSGAGSGISTIEQASKHGQGQKPELQQPDTNAPVRTAEERTCPAADTPAAELAAAPGYLLIPDVTLYKARLVQAYASRCGCTAPSPGGYCFGDRIPANFFGRAYPIREMLPYQPKILKRHFKQAGITRCNLLKKEFPHNADAIAQALGIRQGGTRYAAFTRIGEHLYALLLGNEIRLPAETTPHV